MLTTETLDEIEREFAPVEGMKFRLKLRGEPYNTRAMHLLGEHAAELVRWARVGLALERLDRCSNFSTATEREKMREAMMQALSAARGTP